MSITRETSDHDNFLARYSLTFRQLIPRNGLMMYFTSLSARVKTLQIAQSFIFDEKL